MIHNVQRSESLPVGLLLALAGGILDSYTFLNRGEVFATAETGNLVMLGIHLAQGMWADVLYYLFPILAFAAGVLCTELIKKRIESTRVQVHWRLPLLLVECLVITAVAFLPLGSADALANILISFTSAIQIESFRKFVGCACATTMCTGNLRSGTENLFQWCRDRQRTHLEKAFVYYGLITSFVIGAVICAILSAHWGGHTILIACVPLLGSFTLMLHDITS